MRAAGVAEQPGRRLGAPAALSVLAMTEARVAREAPPGEARVGRAALARMGQREQRGPIGMQHMGLAAEVGVALVACLLAVLLVRMALAGVAVVVVLALLEVWVRRAS